MFNPLRINQRGSVIVKVQILLTIIFLNQFVSNAQSLEGTWMVRKIEILQRDTNYNSCAHGRGVIVFYSDSSYVFYRAGRQELKGRLNQKTDGKGLMSIDISMDILILKYSSADRSNEILELTRAEKFILEHKDGLFGTWKLDSVSSNFNDWKIIDINPMRVKIRSNQLELLTDTKLIESKSGLFIPLAFEYDGFMIHISELTQSYWIGFLYKTVYPDGVIYASEECAIQPILHKVKFNRLQK